MRSKADPGAAVGDQAVQRRSTRVQRRRSGQHLLLEDPRAGAKPAQHRPLAKLRPFGQPVHGQLARAVGGEHLARRGQQVRPVAYRVGAPGDKTGRSTRSLYRPGY
jgi:hypothetical protein